MTKKSMQEDAIKPSEDGEDSVENVKEVKSVEEVAVVKLKPKPKPKLSDLVKSSRKHNKVISESRTKREVR